MELKNRDNRHDTRQGGGEKIDLKGIKERADKAKEEGRLVVLPCKVGDTVYGHGRDKLIVQSEITE